MHTHVYQNSNTLLYLVILSGILLVCGAETAGANDGKHSAYSSSLTGPLGLNLIPSARMDKSGTLSAGLSTTDPYLHGYLGVQLAAPVYINIRQSAEMSSLSQEADRLYPGVDMKLRLAKESRFTPEIALGLQSMIGHKRMSGEYLALSKRYKNIDITAGLGWGRYGTAAHFSNPLKVISSHFGQDRIYDDGLSARPEDWFTGDKVGLFAGIEYFTPLQGLSLKADYGADQYSAETASSDYEAAEPWSVGLNFRPVRGWFDAGIALMGLDKIMARLTLKTHPENWKTLTAKRERTHIMRPHRAQTASSPGNMETGAYGDGALIYNTYHQGHTALTTLSLNAHETTPRQLATAGINMANHAGPHIETLSIRPEKYNLKGPRIGLNRRDLENALAHKQGSAEEIWQNATFDAKGKDKNQNNYRLSQLKTDSFSLILDNQFSLSEDDSGILYRSGIIGGMKTTQFLGLIHGAADLRLNLAHNLERLNEIRPPSFLPVRANVSDFADSVLSLDRSYLTFTHSITPEFHGALSGGYLEEMYGGLGGEVLYRPFGKRFALGAEGWLAVKRDPNTIMHMGFTPDRVLSGHINGWYSIPEQNITIKAQIGRYLAEDIGATIALQHEFSNGATIEGFTTITNEQDYSVFGGTTHAYNGLRLSVPLGGQKYLPNNSAVHVSAKPFGRNYGQSLDKPLDLYKETDALSYKHLARHWHDITE